MFAGRGEYLTEQTCANRQDCLPSPPPAKSNDPVLPARSPASRQVVEGCWSAPPEAAEIAMKTLLLLIPRRTGISLCCSYVNHLWAEHRPRSFSVTVLASIVKKITYHPWKLPIYCEDQMIAEAHHFYQYIGRNVWIQPSHLVRYFVH